MMDGGSLFWMVLITSIVGGLLHLDRTAAFQFLVSRPLVSSTVTGLILGGVETGLLIGIILELLWLGTQPFGTALPPDDTVVAIAAPAAGILAGRLLGSMDVSLLGLSVLVSLPLSEGGRLVDVGARKINVIFLDRARTAAKNGDIGGVERQSIAGLASFFLAFTLLTGAGILGVLGITYLVYPHLPGTIMVAIGWIFWSLPFFGCGAVLGRQKGFLTFGVSYLVAFALMTSVMGGIR
jgi:mannose PTS system EIIC component